MTQFFLLEQEHFRTLFNHYRVPWVVPTEPLLSWVGW